MNRFRNTTLFLLALILAAPLRAQPHSEEPPAAGMPVDFSHVVGRYNIRASADRTDVFVEDPIILKVRILGRGPKKYQPERKYLRLFPDNMGDDFYVEPVPEQDKALPRENAWEFVYRLRAKHAQVQLIPGPSLAYYWPDRQKYQTATAGNIALIVKPKPDKLAKDYGLKVVQAPERLYHLADRDEVLAHESVHSYWTPAVLFPLLLGPPILSFLGLLFWRRVSPDDVQALVLRRSRAARRATHDLTHGRRSANDLVAIMTAYLGERLDFVTEEPTPAEVAQFLKRRGVAGPVRQRWADFLGACDAARFSPGATDGLTSKPEQAADLISALEAELGSRHASRPQVRNLLAVLALAFALPVYAGFEANNPEWAKLAEEAFQKAVQKKSDPAEARKLFAESARLYADLHAHGVSSAALYLNWGNAELLADCVPQAILAYRRGLMLAPGRPDLADNLDFARERVAYPVTATGQRPRADVGLWASWWWRVPGGPRLLLGLATFLLYTLACFSAMAWWRRRYTALPAKAALLLLFAGVCAWLWYREEMALMRERTQPLVVIARETTCRIGNGPSYPAHATLPTLAPGMEARRLLQRGDWLQIQFAGGAIGWVPATAVLADNVWSAE